MQDLRCSESTPSQRLAAAARRERQQRFERSAISRVHEVVELPVDKTERPALPIVPEPVPEPEPDAIGQWVDRQKTIHKEPWFSIVDEILPDERPRPRIEEIQRVVAKRYGVTRSDILSARRTQVVVRPRQVAYYLSKALTLNSLPQIGRRFGDRDHTSVLSGIKKITRLRSQDPALESDLHTLAASLGWSIA